ncbi:response regulator transcription factor [Kutzneria sp. NPDC051319]|uniref:helix-turn-helix transcriptional regulator n=1 Tax=Kutzneria sp. NPDC051319 TaxID=3155047 RepID=UPI0034259934
MVYSKDESCESDVRAALAFSSDVRPLSRAHGPQADILLVVADVVDEELIDFLNEMADAAVNPTQRVVLVTRMIPARHLLRAFEAGVVSVLPRRDLTDTTVARVVRASSQQAAVLPEQLCRHLVDEVRLLMGTFQCQGLAPGGLTPREVEVLRLLAAGEDTAEIARRMNYAERTIKKVIHDLMARLNLRNRTHAVSYAMRMGAF